MKRSLVRTTLQPERLHLNGIRYLKDFFDVDGRILHENEAILRGIPELARFEWRKIVTAIKRSNIDTSLVRNNYTRFALVDPFEISDNVAFCLGDWTLKGVDITQSRVLALVASCKEREPTEFEKEMNRKFELNEENWKQLYTQIQKHSISTHKRSFMFSFYNKLTCANSSFVRVKHTTTSQCHYCSEAHQNYYHLFWSCKGVNQFREAIEQKWFNSERMTLKDWIVGYAFVKTPSDRARAFLAMEANHYIYNSNWEKQELSLSKFKSRIYAMERVEARIAQESNKTLKHHKKWDRIKEFL